MFWKITEEGGYWMVMSLRLAKEIVLAFGRIVGAMQECLLMLSQDYTCYLQERKALYRNWVAGKVKHGRGTLNGGKACFPGRPNHYRI
ncbi:hypothetical protein SLEP1_g59464 [Rubroshorea leprosula]|uniref:Uncharacterized protein n=1 Tax=Rubroshorea leprosula TaxID=152421 RepID=A0AAV5MTK0_9ROSI|nr:hypothetical protein SLEP1_g59464 [Rubroshorea leprosula]